jgi:hypothetical protein
MLFVSSVIYSVHCKRSHTFRTVYIWERVPHCAVVVYFSVLLWFCCHVMVLTKSTAASCNHNNHHQNLWLMIMLNKSEYLCSTKTIGCTPIMNDWLYFS